MVETAVRARADSDRYPTDLALPLPLGAPTGSITARGERIRHDTVGGRTTAWVPSVQR